MNKEPPSLFDAPDLFADVPTGQPDMEAGTHGGLTGAGPLTEQLDQNFMQYARYVIGSRAIPAIEDGLKPVQRRILHAMREIDNGSLMKLPRVIGRVSCYHPHGDASIGPSLVVLANRLWGKGMGYLIEGQGNFGNLYTGAQAAAPRYLECRLTKLAKEQIFNPKTTDYVPSYDGVCKEPVFLPSKLPLLLMMGAEGVAVGLSTSVLPHNFPELLQAEIDILRKKRVSLVPDFQLGGVMDATEYDDGLGRVKVRAVIDKDGKNRLVLRQLPWGETTDSIIESIRQAVEKKHLQIKGIQNLTSQDVEIVLMLSPGADPDKVVEALYAFTTCQKSLVSRPVVLKGGRPVVMRVSKMLKENVERLVALTKREFEIRLGELDEAYHAKTLDQIFVEERIYKRIEEEETEEAVEKAVIDGFKPYLHKIRRKAITSEDVKRLLEVKIRRISRFDIRKNQHELDEIAAKEDEVRKNLKGLVTYVIAYLKGLLREYAKKYPRRTVVADGAFAKTDIRAITSSDVSVRYDRENRLIGCALKGGEELFKCSGLDKLLFLWKDGRYRMMPPPNKLFVDADFDRVFMLDKDKVFTCVYEEPQYGHSYVKRFTFGGMIQNKEYRLAPPKSKILLFQEDTPERLYVKFKPAKGQRVHQAFFDPAEATVRRASARGLQMTTKPIARISSAKPNWWNDAEGESRGGLF
ncbi:MAG: DNA topoisomerase IV subunit A [Kiritimatiellae bacterium]|nr:DNA topoisomerase IV subunit A [Kiritimatiellia bacterium]